MHTLNHLCCKAAVLTTSNLPVYLKFALQFKSELVHKLVSKTESDMAARRATTLRSQTARQALFFRRAPWLAGAASSYASRRSQLTTS
jgi:hypothetical protein